eukprot:6200996-Pleurochrysis_carterae.AAC.4
MRGLGGLYGYRIGQGHCQRFSKVAACSFRAMPYHYTISKLHGMRFIFSRLHGCACPIVACALSSFGAYEPLRSVSARSRQQNVKLLIQITVANLAVSAVLQLRELLSVQLHQKWSCTKPPSTKM